MGRRDAAPCSAARQHSTLHNTVLHSPAQPHTVRALVAPVVAGMGHDERCASGPAADHLRGVALPRQVSYAARRQSRRRGRREGQLLEEGGSYPSRTSHVPAPPPPFLAAVRRRRCRACRQTICLRGLRLCSLLLRLAGRSRDPQHLPLALHRAGLLGSPGQHALHVGGKHRPAAVGSAAQRSAAQCSSTAHCISLSFLPTPGRSRPAVGDRLYARSVHHLWGGGTGDTVEPGEAAEGDLHGLRFDLLGTVQRSAGRGRWKVGRSGGDRPLPCRLAPSSPCSEPWPLDSQFTVPQRSPRRRCR